MTDKVTVEFSVISLKDVPVIGKRRVLFVNGKRESMVTSFVEVECYKTYDDDTKPFIEFTGRAVYRKDIWR